MKVIVIAGYSGSGKTTLVERIIPELKLHGLRVSVIKHAHHKFDIDHKGKDTWRHREAGAYEVLVASDRRMALMREFEHEGMMSVRTLIAEVDASVDWVMIEGFKQSNLPKIEVWRPASGKPARYQDDEDIVAIATDAAQSLQPPPQRPVLDLNDPAGIARWLLTQGQRFEYHDEHHV